MEAAHRNAEHEGVVNVLRIPRRFEPDPPERERERNRRSEQASPCYEPVRSPSHLRPPLDEPLQKNIIPENSAQAANVARELLRFEKDLPPTVPVQPRRWPPQPHGIPVSDSKSGKHRRTSVGNKRRIEIAQSAAP